MGNILKLYYLGTAEIVEDISSAKSSESTYQTSDKRQGDQLDNSFTSQRTTDLSFRSAVSRIKSSDDTFTTADFESAGEEEDLEISSFGNSDPWFRSLEYDSGSAGDSRLDGDRTFSPDDTHQDPDLTLRGTPEGSSSTDRGHRPTSEQGDPGTAAPLRTPRANASTPDKSFKLKDASIGSRPALGSNDCDILPCDNPSSADTERSDGRRLDSSFREGDISPILSATPIFNSSSRRSLTPKRDFRSDKENQSPLSKKRSSLSETVLYPAQDINQLLEPGDNGYLKPVKDTRSPVLGIKENHLVGLKENVNAENVVSDSLIIDNYRDNKNAVSSFSEPPATVPSPKIEGSADCDAIKAETATDSQLVLREEQVGDLAHVKLAPAFDSVSLEELQVTEADDKVDDAVRSEGIRKSGVSRAARSGWTAEAQAVPDKLLDISNSDLRFSFYINSKSAFNKHLPAASKLDLLFSVDSEGIPLKDNIVPTFDDEEFDRRLDDIPIPSQDSSFDFRPFSGSDELDVIADRPLSIENDGFLGEIKNYNNGGDRFETVRDAVSEKVDHTRPAPGGSAAQQSLGGLVDGFFKGYFTPNEQHRPDRQEKGEINLTTTLESWKLIENNSEISPGAIIVKDDILKPKEDNEFLDDVCLTSNLSEEIDVDVEIKVAVDGSEVPLKSILPQDGFVPLDLNQLQEDTKRPLEEIGPSLEKGGIHLTQQDNLELFTPEEPGRNIQEQNFTGGLKTRLEVEKVADAFIFETETNLDHSETEPLDNNSTCIKAVQADNNLDFEGAPFEPDLSLGADRFKDSGVVLKDCRGNEVPSASTVEIEKLVPSEKRRVDFEAEKSASEESRDIIFDVRNDHTSEVVKLEVVSETFSLNGTGEKYNPARRETVLKSKLDKGSCAEKPFYVESKGFAVETDEIFEAAEEEIISNTLNLNGSGKQFVLVRHEADSEDLNSDKGPDAILKNIFSPQLDSEQFSDSKSTLSKSNSVERSSNSAVDNLKTETEVNNGLENAQGKKQVVEVVEDLSSRNTGSEIFFPNTNPTICENKHLDDFQLTDINVDIVSELTDPQLVLIDSIKDSSDVSDLTLFEKTVLFQNLSEDSGKMSSSNDVPTGGGQNESEEASDRNNTFNMESLIERIGCLDNNSTFNINKSDEAEECESVNSSLENLHNMTEDEMTALLERQPSKTQLNISELTAGIQHIRLSTSFTLEMKPLDLNTTEAGPMTAADDIQSGELSQLIPDADDVDIGALKRKADENVDESLIRNFDPLADLPTSSNDHLNNSLLNIGKESSGVEVEVTPIKDPHVGLLIPITPMTEVAPKRTKVHHATPLLDHSLEESEITTPTEKGDGDCKVDGIDKLVVTPKTSGVARLRQKDILSPVQVAITKELSKLQEVSMERMRVHETKKKELLLRISEAQKRKENNAATLKKLGAKMPFVQKLERARAANAQYKIDLSEASKKSSELLGVVGVYEKTMRDVLNNSQSEKNVLEVEVKQLAMDRDTAKQHVANMDTALNDIHMKHDRSVKMIEEMAQKYNKKIEELRVRHRDFKISKENYNKLLNHATFRLQENEKEWMGIMRKHDTEVEKTKALIEQQELKIKTNELSIKQKQKELSEVRKIYEDLLRKLS